MADVPGQAVGHVGAGEVFADEAEMALVIKAAAVEADDAAAFLAAMLQAVQAERGEDGGVLAAEDAKNAALFARLVVEFPFVRRVRRRLIEVEGGALGGHVVLRLGAGPGFRGAVPAGGIGADSPSLRVDYITRPVASLWQHRLQVPTRHSIDRIGSRAAYGVLHGICRRALGLGLGLAHQQHEQRHHQNAAQDAKGEARGAVKRADFRGLVGGFRDRRGDHGDHDEDDQEDQEALRRRMPGVRKEG